MTGVAQFNLLRKQQQRTEKRQKKKLLRSGSGIRNRLAKAEGIPNEEGSSVPEINQRVLSRLRVPSVPLPRYNISHLIPSHNLELLVAIQAKYF